MTPNEATDLATGVREGEVRAVARAISAVEDDPLGARPLLEALFPHAGEALVLGVTGPPGGGKSTLVDQITRHLRGSRKTVGVIAVDPTSPFSGGAILGDRIRMQSHATDPGTFIRSMATRGHLGGLAAATRHVITVLAASGKDVVIVETVGVGQGEVDVAGTADVSLVVLVPGLGDEVQALKAGIMEIADVFVVNKADRDGVDRVFSEIESMLSMAESDAHRPEIVRTIATGGVGIDELMAAIYRFRDSATASGFLEKKRRAHLRRLLEDTIQERLARRVGDELDQEEARQTVDRLVSREIDPFSASDRIFEKIGLPIGGKK